MDQPIGVPETPNTKTLPDQLARAMHEMVLAGTAQLHTEIDELRGEVLALKNRLSTTQQTLTLLGTRVDRVSPDQFNCPHCTRRLDERARYRDTCPVCGGSLRE